MNILPKKKWHVRTKENVARVRRDEGKAAEEERRRLERQILAQNERRINALRQKADVKMTDMYGVPASSSQDVSISNESGHVNLFQDLEREERKNLGTGNVEYADEKAQEKKEWESKMGIQVYLADGASELNKKGSWYEKMPLRKAPDKKSVVAPLLSAPQVEPKKDDVNRKRHRKRSSSTSSSASSSGRKKRKKLKKKKSKKSRPEDDAEEERRKKDKLMALRDERLRREREEASRTRILLNPQLAPKAAKKPKYNSMFNPGFSK